ncbi:MAG: hypothetical protein ACK56Q_19250, partial [Pirellulaceae bacterium]
PCHAGLWSNLSGAMRAVRFYCASIRTSGGWSPSATIWEIPERVSGLPLVVDLAIRSADR